MDLSRIKQFVKQNGDKFIFIENGEPEAVIMSFHEYEKMLSRANGNPVPAHTPNSRPLDPLYSAPAKPMFESRDSFPSSEFSMEEPMADTEQFDMVLTPRPASEEPRIAPMRLENIRLEDLPI